jgi:hypothetical protein
LKVVYSTLSLTAVAGLAAQTHRITLMFIGAKVARFPGPLAKGSGVSRLTCRLVVLD